MQAIATRYHGPTNGVSYARVSATCNAKRIYYSWQHDLSDEDNHKFAFIRLARQLYWFGPWQMGSLPRSEDYVFVRVLKYRDVEDRCSILVTNDTNGELER